ncbi:MAG: hypothetical protein GQ535_17460 [Rhodobacteraceae bacterium]|nr:hypothetical protein [Paracoccaceae bacterium]
MESEDAQDIVFLDRNEQRTTLLASLPPMSTRQWLRIIRGPKGIGKSALSDCVTSQIKDAVPVIYVDPLIRGDVADHRSYDGLYVQLCVEALSEFAKTHAAGFQTFDFFIKDRGFRNLKGIDPNQIVRDGTSGGRLIGHGIDAVDRVVGRGHFSATALLNSDSRAAIEVCAEYFAEAIKKTPCVMVIREGQHFDHYSLKHILGVMIDAPEFNPIIEYTSEDSTFQKTHQPIFDRVKNRLIWDITELPWEYVLQLLERNGSANTEFAGEFRAKWNGNLRTVEELLFKVGVGHGQLLIDGGNLAGLTAVDHIQARVAKLVAAERYALALIAEFNEPMPYDVLDAIWVKTALVRGYAFRTTDVVKSLAEKRFIQRTGEILGLKSDDIATATKQMKDAGRHHLDARNRLLDYFYDVLETSSISSRERGTTIRHAVRLAAIVGDTVRVSSLLTEMETDIAAKGCSDMYIDAALSCLSEPEQTTPFEKSTLGGWAATKAYETSDFNKTLKAIELGELQGAKWDCVRAFSHIEEGIEDLAEAYANNLRNELPFDGAEMMSDIILANIDLTRRRYENCKRRLGRALAGEGPAKSVLAGHAHRLLEFSTTDDASILHCQQSADIFKSFGLDKSEAYSLLAKCRHLARTGKTDAATRIITKIRPIMMETNASRQFLLNNEAAVILLSHDPDTHNASELLRSAYLASSDKFSDIVILQNTAIALELQGNSQRAIMVAEQMVAMLAVPDTTSRLIAPSTCANAGEIFLRNGLDEKAAEVFKLPEIKLGLPAPTGYWGWRYKLTAEAPNDTHAHLAQSPFHPVFLSQWQVDHEVLSALFAK